MMNFGRRNRPQQPQPEAARPEVIAAAFDFLYELGVVTYFVPDVDPEKGWRISIDEGGMLKLNPQQAEIFVIGALTANLVAEQALSQLNASLGQFATALAS